MDAFEHIRNYYNSVYFRDPVVAAAIPAHYRALAKDLGICHAQQVLDVGCGLGDWLRG